MGARSGLCDRADVDFIVFVHCCAVTLGVGRLKKSADVGSSFAPGACVAPAAIFLYFVDDMKRYPVNFCGIPIQFERPMNFARSSETVLLA